MIPLAKGDKIDALFMHAWIAMTFFKISTPIPGFIKFAKVQLTFQIVYTKQCKAWHY